MDFEWGNWKLKIFVCQLEEMMRWADKDGDGKVGFQEFAALMSVTARGHGSEEMWTCSYFKDAFCYEHRVIVFENKFKMISFSIYIF